MNTEVIKAMNKKEKKHPVKEWWRKNAFKVYRVIFFPLYLGIIITEKIKKYLNNRQVWSEERANEILSYYVPRKAEWCEEDKTFYFFDNGMGWGNLAKRYLKIKDRRWWNCHRGFWGSKIRTYLIDEFEFEGFKKEVGDCSDGCTEVSFTLIEK